MHSLLVCAGPLHISRRNIRERASAAPRAKRAVEKGVGPMDEARDREIPSFLVECSIFRWERVGGGEGEEDWKIR